MKGNEIPISRLRDTIKVQTKETRARIDRAELSAIQKFSFVM